MDMKIKVLSVTITATLFLLTVSLYQWLLY